ncbi:MAG: hypothetical protein Q8L21_02045 [Candidatus Komeilibacteria bacterium]|nr:hypothetical protein [Candidatus Komeilibacteria bacterium]
MTDERFAPTTIIQTLAVYREQVIASITEVACAICGTNVPLDQAKHPNIGAHKELASQPWHELTVPSLAAENIFLCPSCAQAIEAKARGSVEIYRLSTTIDSLAKKREEHDRRRQAAEIKTHEADLRRQAAAAKDRQATEFLANFGVNATALVTQRPHLTLAPARRPTCGQPVIDGQTGAKLRTAVAS